MFLMEAKFFTYLITLMNNNPTIAGTVVPTTTSTTQTTSSSSSASPSVCSWILLNIVLPVALAVVSAAAVSVFTTKRTYRREKRIAAKYGHHQQLNQALSDLTARFNACSCDRDCNPFCMKYSGTVLVANGLLQIPLGNQVKCKNAFLLLADRINKLISEQDVNINPSSISLEDWTSCQNTLREFTQLIIEDWGVGTVDSNTGIHRNNWSALQTAINKIMDATDYTKQG